MLPSIGAGFYCCHAMRCADAHPLYAISVDQRETPIRLDQSLTLALALGTIALFTGCIVTSSGEPIGALASRNLAHVTGIGVRSSARGCECAECCAESYGPADAGNPPASEASEAGHCDPGPGLAIPWIDPVGPLYTVAALPAAAVGCVANGCVAPAACMGPPDLPPPSRFNPVPTQPVFAPRQPSGYTIPSRL